MELLDYLEWEVDNYWVIVNPNILSETVASEGVDTSAIETNISFPQLESTISRPSKIRVSYTSYDHQEEKIDLSSGCARIFLQNYDILFGKSIIWWYRTYGNVRVREEYRNDFPNLIEWAEHVCIYYPFLYSNNQTNI